MHKSLTSLAIASVVLSGCGAIHREAAETPSPPPASAAPSPSAFLSPPPASDAVAVARYVMLPADAGFGRYGPWKQAADKLSMARYLSICSSYAKKELLHEVKADYDTARLVMFEDKHFNQIVQSVLVTKNGVGPKLVELKDEYDGKCPAGNTKPLTAGFVAPKEFPDAKAFCSRPYADAPALIRCSTAIGRGHVYVHIETNVGSGENDAASNLTQTLAFVAPRLAQLPE